jgi:hypothetical protein
MAVDVVQARLLDLQEPLDLVILVLVSDLQHFFAGLEPEPQTILLITLAVAKDTLEYTHLCQSQLHRTCFGRPELAVLEEKVLIVLVTVFGHNCVLSKTFACVRPNPHE